jgi:hypothetical protein
MLLWPAVDQRLKLFSDLATLDSGRGRKAQDHAQKCPAAKIAAELGRGRSAAAVKAMN